MYFIRFLDKKNIPWNSISFLILDLVFLKEGRVHRNV